MKKIRADRHLARRETVLYSTCREGKWHCGYSYLQFRTASGSLISDVWAKPSAFFFVFFFSLGKEVTSPLISTSDSIENCSGIQLVRFNSIKGARRRQGRMCQVNLRLTLKDRVSRTSTPRPYFLREREKKKKPSNFLLLNTPTQMNSCTVVREGEREKDVKE